MFLSRNFVLLTEESRCQVLFVVFFVIVYNRLINIWSNSLEQFVYIIHVITYF